MNNITNFYKILKNNNSKLSDKALLKERFGKVDNNNLIRINSKIISDSNFIETFQSFYDNNIHINKIMYYNMFVKKNIYHNKNNFENLFDSNLNSIAERDETTSKRSLNISFENSNNLGNLISCPMTTTSSEANVNNLSSKFNFFMSENDEDNIKEVNSSDTVTLFKYSSTEINENSILYISLLDLSNAKYDSDIEKITFSSEPYDFLKNLFKLEETKKTNINQIKRTDDDKIWITNENGKYNLYFYEANLTNDELNDGLSEGAIEKNILSFSQGDKKFTNSNNEEYTYEIEYWETETASEGVHFHIDDFSGSFKNHGKKMTIGINEIFETVNINNGLS